MMVTKRKRTPKRPPACAGGEIDTYSKRARPNVVITKVDSTARVAAAARNNLNPLFLLPGELRNNIYSYILIDTKTLAESPGTQRMHFPVTKPSKIARPLMARAKEKVAPKTAWIALGQVCQQIRAEYRPFQQANSTICLGLVRGLRYIDAFYPLRDMEIMRKYVGDITFSLGARVRQDVEVLHLLRLHRAGPDVKLHYVAGPYHIPPSELDWLLGERLSLRSYVESHDEETCPISSIRVFLRVGGVMVETLDIYFKRSKFQPWMDGKFWKPKHADSQRTSSRINPDSMKRKGREAFIKEAGLEGLEGQLNIRLHAEEVS